MISMVIEYVIHHLDTSIAGTSKQMYIQIQATYIYEHNKQTIKLQAQKKLY